MNPRETRSTRQDLLTYVSQTLDDAILKDPLGGDVEITLGTEVYRQPVKSGFRDHPDEAEGS